MLRRTGLALVCALAVQGAQAHEFWIEPDAMAPPAGATVAMQVRVGERLDGDVFPFEPRAYAQAYWVGPHSARVLHAQPVTRRDISLAAQGAGLHILAVASFGQRLKYASLAEFEAFAESVGAGAVLQDAPPVAERDGSVREVYRRFSKTLVRFGGNAGHDRRLGLEYEWVQSGDVLTLFASDQAVQGHPVDLLCEDSNAHVRQTRLQTDTLGQVRPEIGDARRCLINAVFLTPPAVGGVWTSDWVSLLWAQ